MACHSDHRARRRIKIHFVEAVFPEDMLDVVGVAIGWINHSPTDDDSNEKTRGRERFVIVRPLANFYCMKLAKSRLASTASSTRR